MGKLSKVIGISLAYFFIFSGLCFACVGARPLAMGGAFIAVGDDANTTYWNPAGLDQRGEEVESTLDELEGMEITYTPTIHNRDEINYDDFVSLITPIKLGQQSWGGLGLSFINSGYNTDYLKISDSWYWVSYGKNLGLGLSLGVNLRYQRYKHRVKEGWMVLYPSGWVIGPQTSSDDFFAIDPALLWRLNKFSFGLLYQDINEPEVEVFNTTYKWIKNLRPGIAFRPDDKTVIAVDMYDAAGETKNETDSVAYDLRVGIERWFDLPQEVPEWIGDKIALRAGGYHINRGNRAITFGVGVKGEKLGAFEGKEFCKSVQLDYCLIWWTDAPSDTDEFTHLIGLSFKF